MSISWSAFVQGVRGIIYPKGSSPLKWKEISVLFITFFSVAMSITMLFPFLPAMVKQFGKTEEETGYYAGLIASAMYFGRGFSSYFWGCLADKIGRRPVIICSLCLISISTTAFGFSSSIPMAISMRFIMGLFNGIIGTVKAIISELCDSTNQSLGMASATCAYSTGLIFGPAVGGFLSETGKKYPSLFPKGSLFEKFPFLLPCLVNTALLLLSAIIAYFCLTETLEKKNKSEESDTKKGVLVDENTMKGNREMDKDIDQPKFPDRQRIAKHEDDGNGGNVGETDIEDPLKTTHSNVDSHQPNDGISTDTTSHTSKHNRTTDSTKDTHVLHNTPDLLNTTGEVEGHGLGDCDHKVTKTTRQSIDERKPSKTVNSDACESRKLLRRSASNDGQNIVCLNVLNENGVKNTGGETSTLSSTKKLYSSCAGAKESNAWKILRNRNAVLSILGYSIFSFSCVATEELFNIWAATEPGLGGLGFTTDDLGTVLLIMGIIILFVQPIVLPKVEQKVGLILNLQLCSSIVMFFSILLPCLRIFYNRSSIVWPLLLVFMVARSIAVGGSYISSFLLINNSVNPDLLCSVNGLAMAVNSLFKALGPSVSGSLFAWSVSSGYKIGFPFNVNLAFIFCGFTFLISIIISCFLSESILKPKKSEQIYKSKDNILETKT